MSVYDPAQDSRVIAVRSWAENHGQEDVTIQVELMDDWDIAMAVQFTRTDEGALKKFVRVTGIGDISEFEPPVVERVRKEDIWPDIVGWERPACPDCFTVPSLNGTCECTHTNKKEGTRTYENA